MKSFLLAVASIVFFSAPLCAAPAIHPQTVRLLGPESYQQLVVTETNNQRRQDVTRTVQYKSLNPQVAQVSPRGLIQPVANGQTVIEVTGSQGTSTVPVSVEQFTSPPAVSFRNQIQPILTKASCNSGSCHGKAEGQNGFMLSLFGFDHQLDHETISKEGRGRRISISAPASSLLLRKATGVVPHGGGYRVGENNRWYQRIERWIEEGAQLDPEPPEDNIEIEVYPPESVLEAGKSQQLQVFARGIASQPVCVTHEAEYISNATEVAAVDSTGWVEVDDVPGEAAILVRYLGKVTVARIRLPQQQPTTRPPANNAIDKLVWDRLQTLGLQASATTSDAQFLRRVYLDTIGTLPTPPETRTFLADQSAEKRTALITRLLQRKEYAQYWAMKWADILRVDKEIIKPVGTIAMTRWLTDQFANNLPYDQFVRKIVTAQGNTLSESPAAFYLVHNNPEKLVRSVSQVFLGVRIECAQCHHHPFEKWSQTDYAAFGGFFTGVSHKGSTGGGTKIFDKGGQDQKHPRTGEAVPTAGLGAPPLTSEALSHRREALASWMTAADNPFLTRMIANRLWAHYLGRGLVEPIDDMRATNPATNEPLLELLAQRLVSNGYDLKDLTQFILSSKAYQLSAETNDSNARDNQNFSHASWKPVPAEVLLDAISQVTGVAEQFNGWPDGYRAIEIWDNRMPSYFFRIFGKPQRVSVCECERGNEPSIVQALHLMNSTETMSKINHRQGQAIKLATSTQSDDKIIEELYLAALARFPREEELALMQTAFDAQGTTRRTAVEDIMWTLLNTREFIFNH
jgi:hypothetical protein